MEKNQTFTQSCREHPALTGLVLGLALSAVLLVDFATQGPAPRVGVVVNKYNKEQVVDMQYRAPSSPGLSRYLVLVRESDGRTFYAWADPQKFARVALGDSVELVEAAYIKQFKHIKP